MFNLDKFITDSLTYRPESMFKGGIEANAEKISLEIKERRASQNGRSKKVSHTFGCLPLV